MAKVRGTKAVRAAIRRATPDLRAAAIKEVAASTKAMHRDVQARFNTAATYAAFHHGKPGMQNIRGVIRRLYRYSVSKKQLRGRVGILSAASMRKAWMLKFFLFGSVNQPARNVHDDAFEAEREPYIQRQKRALERVLRRLFP